MAFWDLKTASQDTGQLSLQETWWHFKEWASDSFGDSSFLPGKETTLNSQGTAGLQSPQTARIDHVTQSIAFPLLL